MWYSSSSGRIELKMTRAQAESATHPGPCDRDVFLLSEVPSIKRQVEKINPELLSNELREYGAWNDEELSDHQQNIQRLLWIAAGDICDRC